MSSKGRVWEKSSGQAETGNNESESSGAGRKLLKGFGAGDTRPECAASGDKIAEAKASKQGAQFHPPSPPSPVILLSLQLRCSEIAATMKCSCGGCSVRNSEPLRPREAACWGGNAIGHKAFCNGRCHCGGLVYTGVRPSRSTLQLPSRSVAPPREQPQSSQSHVTAPMELSTVP